MCLTFRKLHVRINPSFFNFDSTLIQGKGFVRLQSVVLNEMNTNDSTKKMRNRPWNRAPRSEAYVNAKNSLRTCITFASKRHWCIDIAALLLLLLLLLLLFKKKTLSIDPCVNGDIRDEERWIHWSFSLSHTHTQRSLTFSLNLIKNSDIFELFMNIDAAGRYIRCKWVGGLGASTSTWKIWYKYKSCAWCTTLCEGGLALDGRGLAHEFAPSEVCDVASMAWSTGKCCGQGDTQIANSYVPNVQAQ